MLARRVSLNQPTVLSLCSSAGHSLGGSVAQLCTLRLLSQLPEEAKPSVRCITFACPAVGNPALSSFVQERGWDSCFQNLLIPGAALLLPPAWSLHLKAMAPMSSQGSKAYTLSYPGTRSYA